MMPMCIVVLLPLVVARPVLLKAKHVQLNRVTPDMPCTWGEPTTSKNVLQCGDGSSCDAKKHRKRWSCCNDHGFRAKCPKNFPFMCNDPTAAAGGMDFGCEATYDRCDQKHGGLRPCIQAAAPGPSPAVPVHAIAAPDECPWLQGSTAAADTFLCSDGSSCSGTQGGMCCRGPTGGVAKCPPNLPFLCASGICATRCETAGGPRVCDAHGHDHGEDGIGHALALAPQGYPLPLIDRQFWWKAEMCAHQYVGSDAFGMCREFMRVICNPGFDFIMNGSPGERTTGQGWCTEFFNRSPGPPGAAPGPAPMGDGHNAHDAHFFVADRRMIFGDWTMEDIRNLGRRGIEMHVEDVNQRFMDASGSPNMPQLNGSIVVQGPLPYDFPNIFAGAVAEAVLGCKPSMVKIVSMPKHNLDRQASASGDVRTLFFTAPEEVVKEVVRQSADQHSHLSNGRLRRYLMSRSKFHRYSEEEHEFWMS